MSMIGYLYSGASMYSAYNSQAASAQTEAEQAKIGVNQLNAELHRFAVANQALWELLCDKLGVTDNDLAAKIQEVEARQTEKHGAPICPQCHRPTLQHQAKCMYCGSPIDLKQSPFG